MRTALITTTIYIPKVLKLYRAHDRDVRFFVAIDEKTPELAVNFLTYDLDNTEIIYTKPTCKTAELIGTNTIARRNLALLEALKWGAELVITIDDDNIPLNRDYFFDFAGTPENVFDGLQATSESGWFDVGQLLDPISPHRGFPHTKTASPAFSHCTGRKVGVAAGICLGDPDISAITRIARAPIVHRVSELLRAGIVVDPTGERRLETTWDRNPKLVEAQPMVRSTTRGTWTVFNSQNTAIIRELAPAFFMVPQWGRYDDIFASLVVQRLCRERGFVIHFGLPLVWQHRNAHDLLRDLRAEYFGQERILDFTQWLDGFVFTGKEKVTDQMRVMFTNLPDWMPDRGKIQEMVMAWCSDCDEVMK